MTVRTRIAPSPTGEFHIGGMRTLLYNYAFAKKYDGELVIRIEDTDKNREVEGALDRILDVIKKYGLNWDEGPDKPGSYGPYIQSERLEIYNEYVNKLLDNGHAYYCFCTQDRLSELRKKQASEGKITKYDKKCLSLSSEEVHSKLQNNEPYVVRLKVPANEDISWEDLVVGKVTINTNEVDDQVLLKSDGYPTYHVAVVVDDYLMKISHIFRGNEWLPSTPKQLLLYKFLDWESPKFGHLPNLKDVGSNKKLSKRHGDVHAQAFLAKGYLPEALLNFLMFLGWNPGTEKEIYSLQEFVQDFDIEKVHNVDLVSFDRDKLLWINGIYIRNQSNNELLNNILEWHKSYNRDSFVLDTDMERLLELLPLVKDRMKTLDEFEQFIRYFFYEPDLDKEKLQEFGKEKTKEIISKILEVYEGIPESDWNADNLDTQSHEFIKNEGYRPKEAFMTVRIAVTGEKATPPLFETLEVLKKQPSIKRLKKVLELL